MVQLGPLDNKLPQAVLAGNGSALWQGVPGQEVKLMLVNPDAAASVRSPNAAA